MRHNYRGMFAYAWPGLCPKRSPLKMSGERNCPDVIYIFVNILSIILLEFMISTVRPKRH